MSGFFGMNLVSGLEEAQYAFPIVIAVSTFTGAAIALFSLNYMSGRTMQRRAEHRIREIETLSSALSDMAALDYTVRFVLVPHCLLEPLPHHCCSEQLKTSVGKGMSVTKAEFQRRLRKARQSQYISDDEVHLLFQVFDKVKDGLLTLEEFSPDKAAVRWDRDKDGTPPDGPV